MFDRARHLLMLLAFCGQVAMAAPFDGPALQVLLPGDALPVDDTPVTSPAPALSGRWFALALDGNQAVLSDVKRTRAADVTVEVRSSPPTEESRPPTPAILTRPARHALDLPASALLGFQLDLATVHPGRHASLLPDPVVLRTDWATTVQHRGQRWRLSTEGKRRADGQLLAGSLSLVATGPDGTRRVLVPPAHGMAFARQELLWLGSLTPDTAFDLVLKRTWITGEIDHVLVIGRSMGHAYLDPDRPYRRFESGIDAYESFERHVAQTRQPPKARFGAAAFGVSDEAWHAAVEREGRTDRPWTLTDRQLRLGDDTLRFTIERLPRHEATEKREASSLYPDMMWIGPWVLRVHFRGRSQVLMQTQGPDGGGFGVQVDHFNGEPAIEVRHSPHYNNAFIFHWVWSESDGRFLRLMKQHQQGC